MDVWWKMGSRDDTSFRQARSERTCISVQELMNIVHHDLDNFDSVCMATSIHTLANLRCSKAQYRSLFENPEMMRLMAAVRES